jgi:diadenosine tetraphosphatase ApaH/serine/threonine PP2A family protein phosphatase
MKLALITDLHANREAVEAVLQHARSREAQRYAFLGDFVGYGADPAWVVDRVREFVSQGAVAVMGNHDAAVVQGPLPSMIPEAREVVDWTRSQLDGAQLDFLATLPMSVGDGDRLYVHANAYAPSEWGYVLGRMEAVRSLQATAARFTFCGHMHEPKLFHLTGTGKTGDFVPMAGTPIPLSLQRRWLVIPGSTGQPRDGNPAACYALFESDTATLTFHRVPYDVAGASAKIRAAGLPARLADRLHHGE